MVLDTQTLGHELSKILELYKNGSSLPDDSQIFRTDAGKALLEEFKQQNHAPRYLVLRVHLWCVLATTSCLQKFVEVIWKSTESHDVLHADGCF